MQAPSMALLRAMSRSMNQPIRPLICSACVQQTGQIHYSSIMRADQQDSSLKRTPKQLEPKKPTPLRTPELKHRRHRDGELQPKPLSRPLGLHSPPQPGQNTGRDTRTLAQKREDFGNYEKHLERRKQLLSDVFEKNYYKDIGNLGSVHRGKSIISPSTPFRAELALYFPNLEGITLDSAGAFKDTCPVMLGRISIVSMLNSEWATEQAQSFVAPASNPELAAFMRTPEAKEGKAQFVTINVEENPLKAAMIRLFSYRLRKSLPKEQWGTYFLNRRGVTEEIRDALGMWNSKVGYIYLVDGRGRIRWAGNGEASDGERESLLYCLKRLIAEAKGIQKVRAIRQDHQGSAANASEGETALGDTLGGMVGVKA